MMYVEAFRAAFSFPGRVIAAKCPKGAENGKASLCLLSPRRHADAVEPEAEIEPERQISPNEQAQLQEHRFAWKFAVFLVLFLAGTVAVLALEGKNHLSKPVMEQPQDVANGVSPTSAAPHRDSFPAKRVISMKLTRQQVKVVENGRMKEHKVAYWVEMTVGTPPVRFKVLVDTGSGHLILPSAYCYSATCRAHQRYRRSRSTSAEDMDMNGKVVLPGEARDQVTVSFGTGRITGVLVSDVICMGDLTAKLGSPHKACAPLRTIMATEMSAEPFSRFEFDGVLGLGLTNLSMGPEYNVMDTLTGVPSQPLARVFAISLAQPGMGLDAELTLGGWSEDRVDGALAWNKVHQPGHGHWIVKVRSVYVGGSKLRFCEGGCKAVVDTGTSLVGVPSASFLELFNLLRHEPASSGGCENHGPTLRFELEDSVIDLGPEDYGVQHYKPPAHVIASHHNAGNWAAPSCKPMLLSIDLPEPVGSKLFILGEPLLRKYHTVFDAEQQRIGFGRLRH